MASWWKTRIPFIAAAYAVNAAALILWGVFSVGHYDTRFFLLVAAALTISIAAPCAIWLFFEWIANYFNRFTPAATTFFTGVLVCFSGCAAILCFSALAILNHDIDPTTDLWWPAAIFAVGQCQSISLILSLGFLWSLVALDELERPR
jgi:hypothetical protein